MKRIITLLFAILPLLGAAQTSSDLSNTWLELFP